MQTRVALIGIVIEQMDASEEINRILHTYSEWIIGRMGIPHRSRGICVMSVVLDAPADTISALSGKLGRIPHVTTKTIYSKLTDPAEVQA